MKCDVTVSSHVWRVYPYDGFPGQLIEFVGRTVAGWCGKGNPPKYPMWCPRCGSVLIEGKVHSPEYWKDRKGPAPDYGQRVYPLTEKTPAEETGYEGRR